MEKVYRTVIIDDEESAIDNLCFELQRYSYISVEGKAKTGTLGLKIIERVRPDLVFLDVELPDMLGMDVVARLEGYVSWNMKIVLTLSKILCKWKQDSVVSFLISEFCFQT